MAGVRVAAPGAIDRALRLIAIASALGVLTAALVLSELGGTLLVVLYGLPSLALALRRQRQPIAWFLLLTAFGLALGTTEVTSPHDALVAGSADPVAAARAWANGTGWTWVFAGFLGLMLLFPSGSLPRGRLRGWSIAAAIGSVPVMALLLFGDTVNVSVAGSPTGLDIPNPYAVPGIAAVSSIVSNVALWSALFAFQLVGMALLIWRFLRSQGLERLQYRWLAWSLLVVAAGNAGWAVITLVLGVAVAPLAIAVVLLTYPAIPIAVMIAVLRYRLYEIDRIVSRTVGWGLATGAVLVVFAACALALQSALQHVTGGGELAVATSTLVAFTLFQPMRSRVQAVVDRRFDRPRVEAQQTVAQFGQQLQHEVDLATIERNMVAIVRTTLRPASVSVWVRGTGPRSRS